MFNYNADYNNRIGNESVGTAKNVVGKKVSYQFETLLSRTFFLAPV